MTWGVALLRPQTPTKNASGTRGRRKKPKARIANIFPAQTGKTLKNTRKKKSQKKEKRKERGGGEVRGFRLQIPPPREKREPKCKGFCIRKTPNLADSSTLTTSRVEAESRLALRGSTKKGEQGLNFGWNNQQSLRRLPVEKERKDKGEKRFEQ